ncbi:MAG: ABC transporter ATP-binding protein [Candidatus Thorarchaeota archaeon]
MTSQQESVVRVTNLYKSYNGTRVLENVNLSIDPKEFYVLMGPNGSGKSTLLSIIAGTRPFDSGTVEIAGHDMRRDLRAIRDTIGYVPQENFCSDFLTGRENLQYFAGLLGLTREEQRDRISWLLEITGLEDDADRRVGEYSGGMRKKLEVATAFLKDVRVMLLDEPLTGLDPSVRRDFLSMLTTIKARGTAILMVTHIGEDAEIASRIGLMVNGQIVTEGTPDSLKALSGLKSSIIVDARPKTPELVTTLASVDERSSVVDHGKSISLLCDNPAEIIPKIAERLQSSGFEIVRIDARPPTLEDVFYKLTDYPMEAVPNE